MLVCVVFKLFFVVVFLLYVTASFFHLCCCLFLLMLVQGFIVVYKVYVVLMCFWVFQGCFCYCVVIFLLTSCGMQGWQC